jgi:hypothetical protein
MAKADAHNNNSQKAIEKLEAEFNAYKAAQIAELEKSYENERPKRSLEAPGRAQETVPGS